MLELLSDTWDLLATIAVSCWDILLSTLSLVIIDDPFWRGVQCTVIALLVWQNRKALINGIDKVPLLGGLTARGLSMADSLAELALEKASIAWELIRRNTWDRLIKLITKTDKDLRG